MKLLFDQGTPVPLRTHLPHHAVQTAYERGWSDLKNGDLLARAEAEGLDALVTTDQNLRHQQNLAGRKIGMVVLMTTS
jgi:predicted nuclease of predicted toxin-antitoxin system